MFWVIAVLLVFLAALAWRSQELDPSAPAPPRRCPSCDADLVELTAGVSSTPPRAYQVFACTACDEVEATVHGTRSELSYCPACRQRALTLALERLPDGRVKVEEACAICGHRAAPVIPEVVHDLPQQGEGKVIPFRRRS